MASPFQKYQGEQVQPINILPYTGAMAENTFKTLSEVGKDIGGAIRYNREKDEEKAKAAYIANGVIQKYIEQDGPEDDATGEVTYKLSDTAPSHIKDLYSKVQKQPDGVKGISTTDLMGFFTLEQKHQQERQQDIENNIKERGIGIQEAEQGLRKVQVEQGIKKQEQDYGFAVRDLEWRIKRGETGDKLDQDKLALERARLDLEKTTNAERVKLLTEQARQEAIKTESLGRAANAEKAKEAMIQAREGITPTATVPQYGLTETRSGIVRTPDGFYEVTDDIDQFLKDTGLKVQDIEAPSPSTDIPYSTTLSRALSGDVKFDPTLPAVKNPSVNKKKFVQSVYEQLIKNFPDKRDVIDHQFKWNEQQKGENKDVELDSARYDLAVKYTNTKQFQDVVGGSLGIKKETAPVKSSTPPTGVEIISESKTGYGTIKQVVAYKTDQRMVDESYDAAFQQFKDRNIPFPMTRDEAYKIFGLFGGMKRWMTDDGKVMYTNERGETKSQDELEGMGLTRQPTTEYGLKRQAANNWLRRYVPDEKSEGRTVGNYTFTAQTRNKADPMSESGIINPEKAQEDMVMIETNLTKADEYVDRMKALWRDVPVGESVKLWSEWQTEYTTLQRGLETFRKYFIAPGTETERDADRLAEMMVEPRFKTHWQDPEKRQEALDMVRALIANGARAKADAYGITVTPSKGITKSMTNEQVSERIKAMAKELESKYPDKYQKK
jgi:hypothetical protein